MKTLLTSLLLLLGSTTYGQYITTQLDHSYEDIVMTNGEPIESGFQDDFEYIVYSKLIKDIDKQHYIKIIYMFYKDKTFISTKMQTCSHTHSYRIRIVSITIM